MKSYVKEYKGHKVPEGATHYQPNKPNFYEAFINKSAKGKVLGVFFLDDLGDKYNFSDEFVLREWIADRSIQSEVSSLATELPEAPQEWNGEGLPPVGTLCTISADGFEYLFSAASNELSSITESTELVVIGHCTRHDNGAKCVTLMATDSTAARGFTTVNPDFIIPLKTQQEKDREAFIELALVAANCDKEDWSAIGIFKDMFDAGFLAPKAAENDW